jgi:two-component system, NarL family, invasion response regulator UvrY
MREQSDVIRVFLADDHAIVRAGLRRLLADTEDIVVVGEAGDGQATLAALAEAEADVLILDLNMPGTGGLEVLRTIRGLQMDIRVLVLTMYPEDQYALRVFQAGGDGFLSKSTVSDELILAIRRVAADRKYVTPTVAEQLAQHLGAPEPRRSHETLSPRELQTLRLIAAGKSSGDIARELGVSIKTVSTFRYRLLTKLELKNNVEIAHYAVEHGLI